MASKVNAGEKRSSSPFVFEAATEVPSTVAPKQLTNPDTIPDLLKERLQQKLKNGRLCVDESFHDGELIALVDWLSASPFVVREIELSLDAHNEHLVSSLITAVGANHAVRTLTLNGTNVSDAALSACERLLLESKGLEQLHICGKRMGEAGARAVCQALESNETLKFFSIRNAGFGEDGMQALASMLRVNRRITQVYLQDISISDAAAKSLGDAIAENNSLERLDVFGSELSASAMSSLAQGVKLSQSLLQIRIFGYEFAKEDSDEIYGVLRRNEHKKQGPTDERVRPFIDLRQGQYDTADW